MLVDIDLIVDDRDEAGEKIGGNGITQGDQRLLTDARPRGMTNTHEDRLHACWQSSRWVSGVRAYMVFYLLWKESSRRRHLEMESGLLVRK